MFTKNSQRSIPGIIGQHWTRIGHYNPLIYTDFIKKRRGVL